MCLAEVSQVGAAQVAGLLHENNDRGHKNVSSRPSGSGHPLNTGYEAGGLSAPKPIMQDLSPPLTLWYPCLHVSPARAPASPLAPPRRDLNLLGTIFIEIWSPLVVSE